MHGQAQQPVCSEKVFSRRRERFSRKAARTAVQQYGEHANAADEPRSSRMNTFSLLCSRRDLIFLEPMRFALGLAIDGAGVIVAGVTYRDACP